MAKRQEQLIHLKFDSTACKPSLWLRMNTSTFRCRNVLYYANWQELLKENSLKSRIRNWFEEFSDEEFITPL